MSVVTMEEEHLHIVKAFLESGVSPNITQYVRIHIFKQGILSTLAVC